MSTGASGSDAPSYRVGDAEREQADMELREHFAAGRLTVDEYDDRTKQVYAARTQADLDALFTDLPGPRPSPSVAPAYQPPPAPAPGYAAPPSYAAPANYAAAPVPAAASKNSQAINVARNVAPIVGLLLFFVFGALGGWGWSWIFFLLVPLVYAVTGGMNGGDQR